MNRGGYANLAASVRQRLLNLARQTKEEYSIVLIRYAAERWFPNAPFGPGLDAHRGPYLYGNLPHPGKAIGGVGAWSPRPYVQKRPTLGRVVAFFKYQSTKHFNEILATPGASVWQRNYYEHIIRDESDWTKIREYIENNLIRWEEDENHPAKMRVNTKSHILLIMQGVGAR